MDELSTFIHLFQAFEGIVFDKATGETFVGPRQNGEVSPDVLRSACRKEFFRGSSLMCHWESRE